MSNEREESRKRGGQMFIERESMIDSMLRLLWLNAFPMPEPLSPKGKIRVKWKDVRRRGVCICCSDVCLGCKPTFQEARKESLINKHKHKVE